MKVNRFLIWRMFEELYAKSNVQKGDKETVDAHPLFVSPCILSANVFTMQECDNKLVQKSASFILALFEISKIRYEMESNDCLLAKLSTYLYGLRRCMQPRAALRKSAFTMYIVYNV